MKKSLLFVALTGAALVSSCVSDEVVNVQEQQKQVRIGFSSPVLYENAESRANVFGEITGTYKYEGSIGEYTYPRTESFKIFAIQHTGDFSTWPNTNPYTDELEYCGFYGQSLSHDSNVDAWAPKETYTDNGETKERYYYWPANKKLSFAAMSPSGLATIDDNGNSIENANVEPIYGTSGLSINNFQIPADPSNQFDLMFAERIVDKTAADMLQSGAEYYSGIPLTFQHALSSIHFSLKKDNTVSETITLTSIVVQNAAQKGSFCENITTDPNDPDKYVRDENVLPEWDVDYTSLTDYNAFKGQVDFPINPQYVSSLAVLDGTNDDDISHALLLMPQDLTDDLTIVVNYSINGEAQSPKTIKVNDYPQVTPANPLKKWEIGKRYTYRLYYSKESEKKDIIYFAPSVGGWDPVDIIEVRL